MKSFKDLNILNEGISPTLFHITGMDSTLKVLKQDKFFLTSWLKNRADAEANRSSPHTKKKKQEKFFFISTARTMHSRYIESGYQGQDGTTIVLELDGRKLQTRFTGAPVDYWGPFFRSDSETGKIATFEQEDRIFHTKPRIDGASKYITAIHIGIPKDPEKAFRRPQYKKVLLDIMFQAKKRGIKVKFYNTKAKFYSLKQPVDFDVSVLSRKQQPFFSKPDFSRNRSNALVKIRAVIRFLDMDTIEQVRKDKQTYEFMYGLWRNENPEAFVNGIFSDISRPISKSADDSREAKEVEKLTRFMSRNGLKTAKELGVFLGDKYARLLKVESDERERIYQAQKDTPVRKVNWDDYN